MQRKLKWRDVGQLFLLPSYSSRLSQRKLLCDYTGILSLSEITYSNPMHSNPMQKWDGVTRRTF
jgi:hypothetical protein